jgi:hypothetical protein
MQEHAVSIRARLVAQPGGTVFGCAELGSEDPVAVLGTINCLDATSSILLLLEGHIDAKRLVLTVGAFATADGDLEDVAVLAEELGLAEGLEELVFADCRGQAGHVNQVLLDNPNADEILAALLLGLAFLGFFLALLLGTFLLVLLDVCAELGDPGRWSAGDVESKGCRECLLLLRDNLPLNCLVIVGTAARRAQAVHVVSDVVEAELADLQDKVVSDQHIDTRHM